MADDWDVADEGAADPWGVSEAPVSAPPPASPKSGGIIRAALEPVIGAGKEAWRTTKEQAQGGFDNLKSGLSLREASPDEGFWEGYAKDVATVPGKAFKTGKGLLDMVGLPAAPYVGAGKYAIGKPMAHLLSIPNKITGKGPNAEQIYEDIRDEVGSAFGTLQGGARPRSPRNPPRVMGVQLSEGQRTQELPLIQREQAARRNQSGEQAQRETQAWFDNQAREVEAARENVMVDMDPAMTGARRSQRHLVAETPLEAGQIISNGMLTTRNMRRETVRNFYETAQAQPGVIHADFFDNIGNRIKHELSSGPEPVRINDRLTPYADMAMQDIDQNVSNLIMQNRASPNPQPPRSQIFGINLEGVDFMRRRLTTLRRDAYKSGNESDGRAMSAVVDAYDAQINQAMNNGRFTGNQRAIQYWNDARAAHAQYKRDFSAGRGDPAGLVIEKMVGRNGNNPIIANDVVDAIYGQGGTNPSNTNVEVARRIRRILGEDSVEWVAVKQGLFSRLVEPAPGVTEYSPRRVRDRINSFLQNGQELANEVFTPEQQGQLRDFAGLNERLIVPQAGANWSNNPANRLVNRGIQGAGALAGGVVGHMVAPGVPGVAEGLGIAGGNYVGKKIVDAKNAREVRQQLPGSDQQQARPPYTATSPAARAARQGAPRIPNRPESASRRAAAGLALSDQDDPKHKRRSIESLLPGNMENLFPHYAEGGAAPAGQPIVVGEAGPEVVVPQQDVDVIPNHDPMFSPSSPGLGAAPPKTGLGPLMDDPFERAAYRQRQAVQPGREMPVEAAAPRIGSDEEIAEAALMMIGPAGLRAIMAAPKLATAALTGYYGMSSTEEAGSAEEKRAPAQVQQLQDQLNKAGYLDSKDVDGKWGPKTEAAEARFKSDLAMEEQRQQRELETKKTETVGKTADAQAKAADAQAELARAELAKLAQKEKGSERLKDVEKGVSAKQRFLRDYATPVGVTAGIVGGSAARGVVSKIYNKMSGNRAAGAAATMAEEAPDIANRVARVNEFWRKGGGKVPFTNTPEKAPGFSVNPKASDPSKLYQPSMAKNLATDVGVAGGFVGESAAAQHWMEEPARERLALATKATSEDPSEVNIQELQAAKDNLVIAEFWKNFGRLGAVSSVGSAKFMPRKPVVPSMKAAEAEKLSIEELLRNAEAAQTKAAKAAASRATKKSGTGTPRRPAGPVVVPPAQFSPAAAKVRQKTAEESLQSIEQQLASGQN